MRTITEHIVEGDSANHQLQIRVMDEPGQGGACRRYEISGFNTETNASAFTEDGVKQVYQITDILFQNGPIKDFGVNGLTQEALLAIVIDRLNSFQMGPYACEDNEAALMGALSCLNHLQRRTRARIARGVEGTHEK